MLHALQAERQPQHVVGHPVAPGVVPEAEGAAGHGQQALQVGEGKVQAVLLDGKRRREGVVGVSGGAGQVSSVLAVSIVGGAKREEALQVGE